MRDETDEIDERDGREYETFVFRQMNHRFANLDRNVGQHPIFQDE
jgi:hypothetical protein